MKKTGRVGLALLLILIGVAGIAVGLVTRPADSAQSQYLTEKVRRGTVQKSISVSGSLVDNYTYALAPGQDPVLTMRNGQTVNQPAGARGYRTTSLKVAVGDHVSKDKTTAEVKDSNGKKSKIKAPYDGVIRSVSTANGADAAQVATIGVGKRRVSVMVSEYDTSRLKINQNADLRLDANKKTFDGRIASISPVGKTVSGVQKYQVVITTDNVPAGARINMSVTAAIKIKSASNVTTVPLASVTETDDSASVQVLDPDGAVRKQPVNLGLIGDSRVEITKGLAAGDRVITGMAEGSTGGGGLRPPSGAPSAPSSGGGN